MKLLAAFLVLLGPTAQALTFDEAVESAATNSHELRELQLTSESGRWAEQKAMAGFLPRLEVSGRHLFAEQFEVLELEFAGANFAMPAIAPYTSLGVTASYELFGGFETLNQLRAARLQHEAIDHNLNRAREKLRTSVRTLFYRALGSQILVEVADQNIKTLEGHLRDVNARVRSGVSTRFDALRTEVQLEDARTEKVAAESNVFVARARLFEALGRADDGQPLDGKLPEDFSRIDAMKVDLHDAKREDRVAQTLDLEAREHLAKASSSHWYPKVSLFGSDEWYNNSNHSIWEADERFKNAYSFGVQLKWNLFDGGLSRASEQQAIIAKQIAAERLAQYDRAVPVDLEEAKRRFSYNVINFKAKLSSIRKAEEAVRLAQGGVRAGTRTNTEALDAVVDLNRAKAASVKSQVEAIEALGQLELAVGHSLGG